MGLQAAREMSEAFDGPTRLIDDFRDEWAFLSNSHPSKLYFEGDEYRSSEAAFNAGKTLDPRERSRAGPMAVKRGQEFTHPTMLDVTWRPGPGERYTDAPKARCVVTAVRGTTVYFRYANLPATGAAFKADLSKLGDALARG